MREDHLTANLDLLRRTDPQLADRLLATNPAPLQWQQTRTGPWTASIEHGGKTVLLASRYDPAAEAEKTTASFDPTKHAWAVVLGLGVGHHVRYVARRMGTNCVLTVFEPDPAVARAVLEKIDMTSWLGQPHIQLLVGQVDRAQLMNRIERFSAMLTQGAILLPHPPTRQLHPQPLQEFSQLVTEVLAYCRTNVVTALVNSRQTHWNLSLNLPYYIAGAGTDDLHQAARGYPAVCVSAGPSLARNIDLLTNPAVRANVVVITAQTTLKPLLDRGIRPDFVTALDYHEISKRFYEGLPPLPDVTLVAEPQAHPTILDSFPGPVRVTSHQFLDLLLADQAKPRIPIPFGATVSHLSVYLAQHLGCGPIILVGQDLGFSDGLYYCPGTAIHDIWAGELNAFNTLEMLEWQRVVRHRVHLHKLKDVHGQPIYSDEQMLTYLKQFERDFAKAPQLILDATEGGLPKAHTTTTTLADALEQWATRPVPSLPKPALQLDPVRLQAARKSVVRRRDEVIELGLVSRRTMPLLHKMLDAQRDPDRMRKLFNQLQPLQRQVDDLAGAFQLVNYLNTTGAFKRARADRAIHNADPTRVDVFERQSQQLARDIENVDWLIQACEEAQKIFAEALNRVDAFTADATPAGPIPITKPPRLAAAV